MLTLDSRYPSTTTVDGFLQNRCRVVAQLLPEAHMHALPRSRSLSLRPFHPQESKPHLFVTGRTISNEHDLRLAPGHPYDIYLHDLAHYVAICTPLLALDTVMKSERTRGNPKSKIQMQRELTFGSKQNVRLDLLYSSLRVHDSSTADPNISQASTQRQSYPFHVKTAWGI